MALPSIGVRIGLLGGKEYVEDLRRVVQETKTLKEEFKKVSEIEEPFSKASEQIDTLTRAIAKQEEKIRLFNDQLQRSAEKYGEHNSKTEKWRTEIAKAETELAKLKKQLEDLSVQKVTIGGLGELKRDLGTLEQAVRTVKSEFDLLSKQEGVFGSFGRAAGMKTALQTEVAAQKEVVSLLKDEYKKVADAQGEFSEGALKMKENVNKATASLEDMERQLSELPNGLELAGQEIQKVGDKWTSAGSEFTNAGKTFLPATGAFVAGIGATLKTTMEFEQQMAAVGAVTNASADDLEKLSQKAREVGESTKFKAVEAGEAFEYLGRAGFGATDSINMIDAVMALAAADAIDLSESADVVANMIHIFGLEAVDAAHVTDVFAQASRSANTNTLEMAQAAKYAAPSFAALGWKIEDMAFAMDLAADYGIRDTQVGTGLRQALKNLEAPTDTIRAAMEKYGISLDDGTGKAVSFTEFMKQLRGAFGDLEVNVAEANGELKDGEAVMEEYGSSLPITQMEKLQAIADIFGTRAMPTVLAMIGTSSEAFNNLEQKIYNANGAAEEMQQTMIDTAQGDVTILISQLQELALSFGEIVLPVFRDGVKVAQEVVDKFNHMDEGTRKMIISFGLVSAAVGPLLMGIGGIFTGIGSIINVGGHLMSGTGKIIHLISGSGGVLTNLKATKDGMDAATGAAGLLSGAKGIGSIIATAGPYIAATGLIIGAGVLVVKNWDEIKEAAKVLGERIKEKWKNIKEWTSQTWDSLKGTVSKGWNTISDLTGGALKNIGDKVSETVRNALTWGKDFISNLGNGIKNGIEWVGNTSRSVGQRIKDFLGHSTPKEGPLADDDKWMPDMMQNFISGIRNGIPGIENSVSGIGSIIHNGVMGGVSDLQHNLWQTLTYAYETVGNMAPGFESGVWQIGNSMRKVFSELALSAKTWGSDIMQNIAYGINSLMYRVKNAASSVAQTIKNYLGFSEPDKGPLSNFHTYMPDMMKLMAQGINEGLPMVKDAVQHTAYALLPQAYADLPTAAGSTYQTNMGGVTIQVYAQPGQDINELADVIEDRLVALEERRMYAYG